MIKKKTAFRHPVKEHLIKIINLQNYETLNSSTVYNYNPKINCNNKMIYKNRKIK